MGLLKRVGYIVGVMGIISFCAPVLSSESKEIPQTETIKYEPIPTSNIEIVIIDLTEEETALTDCPYSQEEIDLMARVVMSEASILPMDGKQAVAQTILNRLQDGRWGETITEVVYYPNAYSTANNGEPTAECYYAVMGAIEYPSAFPTDMFWFRTDHSHIFGYEYARIGNTYFSTEGETE